MFINQIIKNTSIFCILRHLEGNFVLIFCRYNLCEGYIQVDFANIFYIMVNAWNTWMKIRQQTGITESHGGYNFLSTLCASWSARKKSEEQVGWEGPWDWIQEFVHADKYHDIYFWVSQCIIYFESLIGE